MISQGKGNVRGADNAEKESFVDTINGFLRKYRVVFFGLIGLFLVIVIGIGIYSTLDSMAIKKSSAAIIRMDTAFSDWSSAEDAKKPEKEAALITELDLSEKANQGRYASLRASLLRARLLSEKKEWIAAEEAYVSVYKKALKTDLAPTALLNAAAVAEERGDIATAINHLKRLIAEFPKAAGIAYVHFSLGRLSEANKDFIQAKAQYDICLATYPDDNWTKLAKDRIISLESEGL